MLHECSPRKTLGDSHGLRKCFHRTSLNKATIRLEESVTRNQDCTENCFDPGARHSGRSSLSAGGGHHFYLAVGVQEFRPFMSGS